MNAGIEMDIRYVKEKSLAGEVVQKTEKKGKDKASTSFTVHRLCSLLIQLMDEILHPLILENIPTGSLPTVSFER